MTHALNTQIPSPPLRYRNDFESVHPLAKQMGMRMDALMWGLEELGLLIWFGDLKAVSD